LGGGERALSSAGNFQDEEEEPEDHWAFDDEELEELEEEEDLEAETIGFHCDNVYEALRELCRHYDPVHTSLSDLCDEYGIDWVWERRKLDYSRQPTLFRR
jgi:hypothetical protein